MAPSSHPQAGPYISKRKQIFYRHGFQLRFVMLTAGSLVILLVFTSLHGLMMIQRVVPMDLVRPIWSELQAATVRLGLVGLLYVGVVSLAAMFLSHRVMGPLERLEDDIKKATGSKEPMAAIKVREGDDLEPVVKAINALIEKVKG